MYIKTINDHSWNALTEICKVNTFSKMDAVTVIDAFEAHLAILEVDCTPIEFIKEARESVTYITSLGRGRKLRMDYNTFMKLETILSSVRIGKLYYSSTFPMKSIPLEALHNVRIKPTNLDTVMSIVKVSAMRTLNGLSTDMLKSDDVVYIGVEDSVEWVKLYFVN